MSQSGINSLQDDGAVLTLTGNSGGAVPPSGGNINVVGDGVTINAVGDPGTNTITFSALAEGEMWQTITSSQTLAVNNGYLCISPGGALALALPAVSVVGSVIEVSLVGATSWQITQAANQQITLGMDTTTLGASGYLQSTTQGDSLRLICWKANLFWVAVNSTGNITVN